MKEWRESGITLIELLVVASIIAILVIVLGFSYQGWVGNYRIESQTKSIYSDLMDARSKAMTRKMMHFVVIDADNYAIYEDTNENNDPDPGAGDDPIPEFRDPATGNVKPKVIPYGYEIARIGAGSLPITVNFNTQGLAPNAVAAINFRIVNTLNPDYDCIQISQARIRIGRFNGTSCIVGT